MCWFQSFQWPFKLTTASFCPFIMFCNPLISWTMLPIVLFVFCRLTILIRFIMSVIIRLRISSCWILAVLAVEASNNNNRLAEEFSIAKEIEKQTDPNSCQNIINILKCFFYLFCRHYLLDILTLTLKTITLLVEGGFARTMSGLTGRTYFCF